MAAPIVVAPVPVPLVIAYANHFDDKHVVPALDGTTAVRLGQARAKFVNLKHSTVFRQDYLEGVILAAAAGKAPGDHQLIINCASLASNNFEFAEKTNGQWKRVPRTMFFCNIFYSVGGGVVTVNHLETG